MSKSSDANENSVNDQKLTGPEQVVQGFKQHFSELAIPTKNTDFDSAFKQETDFNHLIIEDLLSRSSEQIEPVTPAELHKHVLCLV